MKIHYKQIFFFAALFAGRHTVNAQEAYTLTVHVTHSKADKLFLLYRKEPDSKVVDTATYTNGKYEFSGRTTQPQQAFLYMPASGKTLETTPEKEAFPVYLEQGHIVVSANETLKGAHISGTPLNNDLQVFNLLEDSLQQIENGLKERFGKAYRNRNNDSLRVITEAFNQFAKTKLQCEERFFQQHTHSHVALEWLKNAYVIPRNKSKIMNLYAQLSERVKKSVSGLAFYSLLVSTPSVELGEFAPVFSEKDTSGQTVSLESYRGKYVLLDFWASWCMPCRKENPNVLKASRIFASKNFTVLGFSLDNFPEEWKSAILKDSLSWRQLHETGTSGKKVADLYGVTSIPSNFLIDPYGKIIATNLRGKMLEDTLAVLLPSQAATTKAPLKAVIAAGLDMTQYIFQDKEGNDINLKKFHGKYIMVDIWASWCYPCKKEFPFFDTLQAAFSKKNIAFIQISCDESKRRWMNEMNITSRMNNQYINTDKRFMEELQVSTIPRYLLIDRKGKLLNAYMTRVSDPVTEEMLLNLKGI